jgi:hypothetical protein
MKTNLTPEDKCKVGIYILHDPATDQAYFGSGVLGDRQKTHLSQLKNGKHHCRKLQRAFDNGAEFDFVGIPVEDSADVRENRRIAYELEQTSIDEFRGSPLLLNTSMVVDANFTGLKHSEESNETNRQHASKRWSDPVWREKVIAAQNTGKAAMTEEEKAARAAAVSSGLKAVYDSGDRPSNKGQVRSEEFCEQNSAKIKDKWQDPDYRIRQIASRQGKTNEKARIPVMGDGVEYPSLTAAAEALGISKQSITYRLQSETYPGWFESAR